jgi:hypothetical protein
MIEKVSLSLNAIRSALTAIAVYLVFTCHNSDAQELLAPPPEASPSNNSGSASELVKSAPLDRIGLFAAQVAVNRDFHQISASPRSLARLVYSVERMLVESCFDGVGLKADERCTSALAELEGLDPRSPVASCLKNGVDSAPCSDSYAHQVVQEYFQEGVGTGVDSQAELSKRLKEHDYETLSAKLERLTSNNKRTPSEQQELESLVSRTVDIFCTDFDLRLEQLPTPTPTIPALLLGSSLIPQDSGQGHATPTPSGDQDSLKSVANMLSGTAEDKKLQGPIEIYRRRLVSSWCMQTTSTALNTIPNFPPAVCALNGELSPQCRSAVKAWRNRPRGVEGKNNKGSAPKESSPNSPKRNFSTF